ncbi:uncharacterized protein CBL_11264 [Carabus blaptoides fortunei]
MKETILLCSLVLLFIINMTIGGAIPQKSVIQHRPAGLGENGIWKKRIEWKASWVKEWEERKVIIPVWRKVWGPIEINEWLPLPKVHKTWKS